MPSYHFHATLLPDGVETVHVWVDGGKLTFSPVDGAEELHSGEAWVLPGLVDSHSHLGLGPAHDGPAGSEALVRASLERHLAAGELAVRDMGGPNFAAAGFQGAPDLPRLQAAGRFIAPEGRYMPIGQWTAAAAIAGRVREHAAEGVQWIKIVGDWPSREGPQANYDVAALRAACETAHALGLRVAVHAMAQGGPLAVEAGVDSVEHGDYLTESDLRALAARGGGWTPTLAVYPGMIRGSVSKPESAERLVREREERMRVLVPLAERLGVTVLGGTDGLPKGSVWREVAALQEYGMSPTGALAAASTSARTFLGLPGFVDGAPADFVVYGADPRSTPEVLRRPDRVVFGGRILGR